MPYYKAQHEVFVRALIRHGDKLLAYQQAYPKASKESAYTAAIRLLRRPEIRERVRCAVLAHQERERERVREREERKRKSAEEDILRRRIWLAKVVRGEVEQKRYFQVRGRTVLVYDNIPTNITIAAIELDAKYEGGYSPKIILDRQFDRLYARACKVIGLNGLIRLNGLIKLNELMELNKSGGQALTTRTSPCPSGASPFEGGCRAATGGCSRKKHANRLKKTNRFEAKPAPDNTSRL